MSENQFFIDSQKLTPAALEKKHRLENDPTARTDHMKYAEGMERIFSDVLEKVLRQMKQYDYSRYSAEDVKRALNKETCGIEEFKALLSPAAEPFLEQMAERAKRETSRHFEIRSTCLHRCISPTTARITASTADSTATTISGGKS